MIVCGWCDASTEPGLCSSCGRDAALPYEQRGGKAPRATESHAGRPSLQPGQIRQKLRIAAKELGGSPTQAQLAEHLDVDVRTIRAWQKVSG